MKILTTATLLFCMLPYINPTVADEKPHAVIVVGTLHYSPESTMPLFANELERLGFRTTVVMGDFAQESFIRMLVNSACWAVDKPLPAVDEKITTWEVQRKDKKPGKSPARNQK